MTGAAGEVEAVFASGPGSAVRVEVAAGIVSVEVTADRDESSDRILPDDGADFLAGGDVGRAGFACPVNRELVSAVGAGTAAACCVPSVV